MPVPPVVVEIQAERATKPLINTLLEACSRAVSRVACVQAAADVEQPTAVAIVTWVGPLNVRIQVGLREDRRWRVREIAFSAADDEVETWRSVGFATGTLVVREYPVYRASEQPADEPAEPLVAPALPAPKPLPLAPPPPSRAVVSNKAPPKPAPVKPSAWTSLDWLATGGRGLDSAGWRWGGMLRGSYHLPFGLLGTAMLAESVRPGRSDGLAAWWTTLGLGFGYMLRFPVIALEFRLAGVAERVAVMVVEERRGEVGSRWVGGGRADADFCWMAHRLVGLVGGVNLGWVVGPTAVTAHGVTVAAAPSESYGVMLGVRLRIP